MGALGLISLLAFIFVCVRVKAKRSQSDTDATRVVTLTKASFFSVSLNILAQLA